MYLSKFYVLFIIRRKPRYKLRLLQDRENKEKEMSIRIGINGYGRISRIIIRIAAAEPDKFEIAAFNYRDVDLDYMIYMLKYDTVFGRFDGTLDKYADGEESGLVINGRKVPVVSGMEPIPWGRYGADYVIEGTGRYTTNRKSAGTSRRRRKEGCHYGACQG